MIEEFSVSLLAGLTATVALTLADYPIGNFGS